MKQFNQQFATQRLREEFEGQYDKVLFSTNDAELDNLLNTKFYDKLDQEGDYYSLDADSFSKFEDDAFSRGLNMTDIVKKVDEQGSVTGGEAFLPGLDVPEKVYKAGYTKKVKEQKDSETKLAAGKSKNVMRGWQDAPSIPNRPSKGGFIYKQLFEELSNFIKEAGGKIHIGTDTKTDSDIYYEPSTGAFYYNPIDNAGNRTNKLQVNTIYDVLAKFPNWKWTKAGQARFPEALDEIDRNDPNLMALRAKKYAPTPQISKPNRVQDTVKSTINMLLKKRAEIERDMEQEAEPEGGPIADKYGDMLNKIDQTIAKLKGQGEWGPETNPFMDKDEIERRAAMMNENYSKFKNETKTRGKSDQFHQAVRQVKKKVQEINRLFEYVSRLKMELSEGQDGLKYKMHTEKALEKIKEMVSALNQNIKKFK